MAVIRNPHAPIGSPQPSEQIGRDDLRERLRVSIERLRIGRPVKSLIIVGLQGVGKTVLLNQLARDAVSFGIHIAYVETLKERSLLSMLVLQIKAALLRMSTVHAAKDAAVKALRALSGFTKTLKERYQDIEIDLDFQPEPGLADNGDLDGDLTALLIAVGEAARHANTALVIFIDDLQLVMEPELAALIVALHRVSQVSLPLIIVGAGPPELRGNAGNMRSYAERLFDYPEIGPLQPVETS
ncbi:ATP-binding protein [Pseudomonas baetica]|uniref:ATP-binding protein n=1 Tax=Pseudomonas baetica TaxID=674054 RepID=UPI0024055B52|nr:ATP-binding protein [Pseudomonas baetica]MDF9775380.1 archaellum biogenesis ATPase FlaH [Pseudomonas baetica]